MNRKDALALILAGPPQLYQGSGPPICTTPQQLAIFVTDSHMKIFVKEGPIATALRKHKYSQNSMCKNVYQIDPRTHPK